MIVILVKTSFGQQDPIFTQYLFAKQSFNPAYCGTWESISITCLARNQWQDFEKRPQTQAVFVQAPMRNNQVAVGISILNDNIGLEKRLSLSADYSYRIKLPGESNLSFGLKAGVTNYSNNLYQYELYDPADPRFAGEIEQKVAPNFGVGVFFYRTEFFIGFSVPKLLETSFKNSENFLATATEQRHYYLTGGYVLKIAEGFAFKPAFLAKAVSGAPVQFDISANFLLADHLWIGGSFRTNDSFGVSVQWIFGKKLRLGYATDFTITNLKNYIDGTHEVMLSFDISSVKENYISPRIF